MKYKEIYRYSNPNIVLDQLHKYYGEIALYLSNRKDKKYMLQDPQGNWVHFGQWGYEDYTKHKDDIRRENFRRRNAKWRDFRKYSAGHLTYYLLW